MVGFIYSLYNWVVKNINNIYLQVKWDVIKRKDVPKKVKPIPTAPLVLIWDIILVVTVACSTSVVAKKTAIYYITLHCIIQTFGVCRFKKIYILLFNKVTLNKWKKYRKWQYSLYTVTKKYIIFQINAVHLNWQYHWWFNTDNTKVSCAANQHIRIISEGSCDAQDWSNGCLKCNFASQ